ncbi:MAG: hypothetical protein GX639_15845 [Fibrobacter sp.]|nr:hypothetical protein [Fibrobacter sp.]
MTEPKKRITNLRVVYQGFNNYHQTLFCLHALKYKVCTTDFGADNGLDNLKLVKRKYFPLMPVENVAKYGYRKFRDGKVIIVPGIINRISTILSSLIPRRMSAGILKMLNNSV